MPLPRRSVAYEFSVFLSLGGSFIVNPTLAAGDFQISQDGSAFVNLTTLPVVEPAGSRRVKINLSALEMTADKVSVVGVDAVGAEWDDVAIDLDVPLNNEEDNWGRSTIDVALAGRVGDWIERHFDPVTDTIEVARFELRDRAGVLLTESHNPTEDNDVIIAQRIPIAFT